jgi:hypothetical protein
VIGIEANYYRILNDQGRPFLYPSRLFKIIDAYKPDDWVTERGDEGKRYAYPPPMNAVGSILSILGRTNNSGSDQRKRLIC